MSEQEKKPRFSIGTRQCGLLLGGIGAAVALCLILFGFWNTLLIALLFGGGYFIGACDHKTALLKTVINKLFPSKENKA